MKKVFVVDWLLIPLAVLCSYNGIELHIAGHEAVHSIWHNWAVFHIITSVLFLASSIAHISMHWNWYKSMVKKGIGTKSKVTILLSLIFAAVTITGFILLFAVNGANSHIGLWHYIIGLIASALFIIHIIKRLPILKKSLKE